MLRASVEQLKEILHLVVYLADERLCATAVVQMDLDKSFRVFRYPLPCYDDVTRALVVSSCLRALNRAEVPSVEMYQALLLGSYFH